MMAVSALVTPVVGIVGVVVACAAVTEVMTISAMEMIISH
jgi:hypothetical protein